MQLGSKGLSIQSLAASLCLLLLVAVSTPVMSAGISFTDPTSDDDGPGTYTYPTDQVYTPGSFDIVEFSVADKGKTVELSITTRAKLENPWSMASGFSLQLAMVFIDMDGIPGSGHVDAIPGINVQFMDSCAWEKAVIVSPQPASRVKDEINAKAAALAADIIVPQSVAPRGKTMTAVIKKEDLGADVSESWGWQVCMTSNEGYPGPKEILTRRVNEFEGQHRFGGGDDFDGDPHVMDILYPPSAGGADEIEGQHKVLSRYVSGSNPSEWVYAKLPCVYPGKTIDNYDFINSSLSAPMTPMGPATTDESVAAPAEAAPVSAPVAAPATQIQAGAFGMKISGKVFMNWLWGNGTVKQASSYIGAFGYGGHHGINSEISFNILANVSDYVTAGARIDNRFRSNFWATYWNNSDLDAAQYMKLRGVWVRFRTPEWLSPAISSVMVGNSDLGMFSPWTVGRIRYIDRDNAAGTFINGRIGSKFNYDMARISLPSLWAGPGWTTQGNGYLGYDGQNGFMNRDFAYAYALNFPISEKFSFRIVGDYTRDQEGDPDDPDSHDGTEREIRFENMVTSVEFTVSPTNSIALRGVYAHASTEYNDRFDYIANWGGYNNMPQKDVSDNAMTLTFEAEDPFGVGLSFAAEYFNVGEDYISLMASRREQDVLLTEGFEGDDVSGPANAFGHNGGYAFDWGGFWGNRGQSPSIMADNGDCQYTETAYESIIGWKGATAIVKYGSGGTDLSAEYTMIDYNTNMQDRDMTVYPSHTGIWFANEDRQVSIALVKGKFAFDLGRPAYITGRVKLISDEDMQDTSTSEDDYTSDKMIYQLGFGLAPTDDLSFEIGYTLFDDDVTYGNMDRPTEKNRLYLSSAFNFGGVSIGYFWEYFSGEDWIGDELYDDWSLYRSRAFLEVAF